MTKGGADDPRDSIPRNICGPRQVGVDHPAGPRARRGGLAVVLFQGAEMMAYFPNDTAGLMYAA